MLEILGIEAETISKSMQSPFKGLPADLKMKCRTVLMKTREETLHQLTLKKLKQKHADKEPTFRPAISETSKLIFNQIIAKQTTNVELPIHKIDEKGEKASEDSEFKRAKKRVKEQALEMPPVLNEQ